MCGLFCIHIGPATVLIAKLSITTRKRYWPGFEKPPLYSNKILTSNAMSSTFHPMGIADEQKWETNGRSFHDTCAVDHGMILLTFFYKLLIHFKEERLLHSDKKKETGWINRVEIDTGPCMYLPRPGFIMGNLFYSIIFLTKLGRAKAALCTSGL